MPRAVLPALLAAVLMAGGHAGVAPASSATGAGARPPGAAHAHLLTPESLPGVGGKVWAEHSTGVEGSRPVGVCQRATLVDIGALDVQVRTFQGSAGSDLRARQAIARYADARSAWRAHEVLRSWRADCAARLGHATEEVGPMVEVDLETGAGGHYLLTHGTGNSRHSSALGIVRHGRWLAVVELAIDDTVPSGWTRRAVRRIAATF